MRRAEMMLPPYMPQRLAQKAQWLKDIVELKQMHSEHKKISEARAAAWTGEAAASSGTPSPPPISYHFNCIQAVLTDTLRVLIIDHQKPKTAPQVVPPPHGNRAKPPHIPSSSIFSQLATQALNNMSPNYRVGHQMGISPSSPYVALMGSSEGKGSASSGQPVSQLLLTVMPYSPIASMTVSYRRRRRFENRTGNGNEDLFHELMDEESLVGQPVGTSGEASSHVLPFLLPRTGLTPAPNSIAHVFAATVATASIPIYDTRARRPRTAAVFTSSPVMTFFSANAPNGPDTTIAAVRRANPVNYSYPSANDRRITNGKGTGTSFSVTKAQSQDWEFAEVETRLDPQIAFPMSVTETLHQRSLWFGSQPGGPESNAPAAFPLDFWEDKTMRLFTPSYRNDLASLADSNPSSYYKPIMGANSASSIVAQRYNNIDKSKGEGTYNKNLSPSAHASLQVEQVLMQPQKGLNSSNLQQLFDNGNHRQHQDSSPYDAWVPDSAEVFQLAFPRYTQTHAIHIPLLALDASSRHIESQKSSDKSIQSAPSYDFFFTRVDYRCADKHFQHQLAHAATVAPPPPPQSADFYVLDTFSPYFGRVFLVPSFDHLMSTTSSIAALASVARKISDGYTRGSGISTLDQNKITVLTAEPHISQAEEMLRASAFPETLPHPLKAQGSSTSSSPAPAGTPSMASLFHASPTIVTQIGASSTMPAGISGATAKSNAKADAIAAQRFATIFSSPSGGSGPSLASVSASGAASLLEGTIPSPLIGFAIGSEVYSVATEARSNKTADNHPSWAVRPMTRQDLTNVADSNRHHRRHNPNPYYFTSALMWTFQDLHATDNPTPGAPAQSSLEKSSKKVRFDVPNSENRPTNQRPERNNKTSLIKSESEDSLFLPPSSSEAIHSLRTKFVRDSKFLRRWASMQLDPASSAARFILHSDTLRYVRNVQTTGQGTALSPPTSVLAYGGALWRTGNQPLAHSSNADANNPNKLVFPSAGESSSIWALSAGTGTSGGQPTLQRLVKICKCVPMDGTSYAQYRRVWCGPCPLPSAQSTYGMPLLDFMVVDPFQAEGMMGWSSAQVAPKDSGKGAEAAKRGDVPEEGGVSANTVRKRKTVIEADDDEFALNQIRKVQLETNAAPEEPAVAPSPAKPTNYSARLKLFYAKYAPDKLPQVDAALAAFKGREEEVFTILTAKYGPEPVEAAKPPPKKKSNRVPPPPVKPPTLGNRDVVMIDESDVAVHANDMSVALAQSSDPAKHGLEAAETPLHLAAMLYQGITPKSMAPLAADMVMFMLQARAQRLQTEELLL
eukprot:GILI01015658.1.p1 GENE.GILI01015658.1~~GILI01015658.1.p1  ORF type:complete len:1333 (+),score=203.70 GILI01015658.1:98-4000(+)